MDKQKIAKELLIVAKELTSGDKQIGFNHSMWGPEDANFTNMTGAWILLSPQSWDLTLVIEKKEKGAEDKNWGSGKVARYSIGTLSSPDLGAIRSILNKNAPTTRKSKDGFPFSKQWTSNKGSITLSEMLNLEMRKAQGDRKSVV